jgi:hypothetical protein
MRVSSKNRGISRPGAHAPATGHAAPAEANSSRDLRRRSASLEEKWQTHGSQRLRGDRSFPQCLGVERLHGPHREELQQEEMTNGTGAVGTGGEMAAAASDGSASTVARRDRPPVNPLIGMRRQSVATGRLMVRLFPRPVVMKRVRRSYREQVTGQREPRCDPAAV